MNTIDERVRHIPGWLTAHEGNFLTSAAAHVGGVRAQIVEIGSYLGKSTICLALSGAHVYAVDPHKGNVSGGKVPATLRGFRKNISAAGVEKHITEIVKTSKEASFRWNKPISLLFIDGLHDARSAQEDFSLWSPHVMQGGMIAMHDAFCGWEGAGRVAMRHIVYSPDYKEIGVVGSIIFGIKGKASLFDEIIKVFRQNVIELCSSIYNLKLIPIWVRYILVHRFLRLFLINRFSSL